MLEHLEEKGWCVVDLPFWGNLNRIWALIERNNPNENWQSFEEDDKHFTLQKKLTDELRKSKIIGHCFRENRQVFDVLTSGSGFTYQDAPYLRIARPHKHQDNIGFHKDTMYGGYAEELSVVIPLIDLPAESSLQVLDGSHKIPDEKFKYIQYLEGELGVRKGDDKNSLGFVYAPKVMDQEQLRGIHPVPLNFGQCLVFYLSTVHGQEVNRGEHTRWSIDTRIVAANSQRDFSQRPYKYVELPK